MRDAKITNDFDPKRETGKIREKRDEEKKGKQRHKGLMKLRENCKGWAEGMSIYPRRNGHTRIEPFVGDAFMLGA